MDDCLIHLQDFLVQQNDYKSICRNHVIEHDNFKFFAILELRDRRAAQHIDELSDGINYSFNKIFKTKSLRHEDIEQLFEKSIKDLNSYIRDLIELSNIPINLKGLHATTGIILDNSLYFTQRGRMHGFFIFKSKNAEYQIIDILKAGAREPKEDAIFTDITHGQIDTGQGLLVCTESVGSYLTEFNIRKILTSSDISEGTIKAHLREITNNENFCGVVVKNTKINASSSKKMRQQVDTLYKESNASMSHLETTRDKTQELLSPTLLPKIKEFIQKQTTKFQNRKQLNASVRPTRQQQKTQKKNTNVDEILDKVTISLPIKEFAKKIPGLTMKFVSLLKKIAILAFNAIQKIRKKDGLTSQPVQTEQLSPTTAKKTRKMTNHLATASVSSKAMGIAILVILVLVVTSSFVIRSKRIQAQQKSEFETITAQIDDNILKAESALIHKADGRANIHLQEVRDLLEQLNNYPDLNPTEIQNTYTQKIADISDTINQVRKISNPQKLIDLSSELANVSINGLGIFEDKLYLYSNSNPYLAITNITDQTVTLVDSPENSINVKDINVFERNNNQPLLLTENNSLYQLNRSSNELSEINISFDHDDIIDFKTFNSSLYTLNPDQNQIFKHTQVSTNNFGRAKRWIQSDSVDLSGAIDMVINGSIYVLLQNGQLLHFLSGREQSFNLETTIQPAVENVSQLAYSTQQELFYVLESAKNRVLVYNTDGQFMYQYVFENMNGISDIIYDDTNNQLLLLHEKQVYQVKE